MQEKLLSTSDLGRTRARRGGRGRELRGVEGRGRFRERTKAGGRRACRMILRIKLGEVDRGASPETGKNLSKNSKPKREHKT